MGWHTALRAPLNLFQKFVETSPHVTTSPAAIKNAELSPDVRLYFYFFIGAKKKWGQPDIVVVMFYTRCAGCDIVRTFWRFFFLDFIITCSLLAAVFAQLKICMIHEFSFTMQAVFLCFIVIHKPPPDMNNSSLCVNMKFKRKKATKQLQYDLGCCSQVICSNIIIILNRDNCAQKDHVCDLMWRQGERRATPSRLKPLRRY